MRTSLFRPIACVLALVLTWGLTGCSDDKKTPKADPNGKPAPPQAGSGGKTAPPNKASE